MNIRKSYSVCLPGSRNKGFTLVELIVVIAILAILSGIAVPAYGNYVRRANEAADRQLIGMVNTAFAAACLENGYDHSKITKAELKFETKDGHTYIAGLQKVIFDGKDVTEQVNDSFLNYFGKNTQTPLKYYTNGEITFFDSVFDTSETTAGKTYEITIDTKDGTYEITIKTKDGNTVTFELDLGPAYADSTFGTQNIFPQMIESMINLVDAVNNNADSKASLKDDDDFIAYLASIGKTDKVIDQGQAGEYLSQYVASKLSVLDADEVYPLLSADGVSSMEAITTLISGKSYEQSSFSDKVAAASLVFGMTGAYSNTDIGESDSYISKYDFTQADLSNLEAFTYFSSQIDKDLYGSYLLSTDGEKDLAAFLSMMQAINNQAEKIDF